jgi:hypothetical protein
VSLAYCEYKDTQTEACKFCTQSYMEISGMWNNSNNNYGKQNICNNGEDDRDQRFMLISSDQG